MADIKLLPYQEYGYNAEIKITVRSNSVSYPEDIETLRQLVKCNVSNLVLSASSLFMISDRIFDECQCREIILKNVILLKDAIKSIPETVYCLDTDCYQTCIDELRVHKLLIALGSKQFNVPLGVRELMIYDSKDITIYCHDNLDKFIFSSGDATATLVNCNNLRKLKITNKASRVYGDFLEYIGCLTWNYDSMYVFNGRGHIDSICEYISLFKNLREYNGNVRPQILQMLVNVRKIKSRVKVDATIDDIPDSLEDMNFRISGYSCSDILEKKSNIKRIMYFEIKLDPISLLNRYPNVYFYLFRGEEERDIEINNKKLTRLVDLA